MIDKQNNIILANWQTGIAYSPFYDDKAGFADMRNMENTIVPGVLSLGVLAAKQTADTVSNPPGWMVLNANTNLNAYALDTSGKVYTAPSTWTSWTHVTGNTVTGTYLGCGMAIWKGYLFIARDTNLDVYDLTSAWTTSFQTLNASPFHMLYTSVDDKLYICNGRYISSLTEVTTFNPASAPTYTWTAAAITLPTGYTAMTLADLGASLFVGTVFGTGDISVTNKRLKKADIFPYLRSSLTLGIPVKIQEFGVNQMLEVNNELFIQAGNTGKYYKTNGTFFTFLTQIPHNSVLGSPYSWTQTYPGGMMYHKNKIFSGVNVSSATAASGVYSFNLDGSGLTLENTLSIGSDDNLYVRSLLSVRDQPDTYLAGWVQGDASARGIDKVSFANGFTGSYGAYVDSQIYTVGDSDNDRTFAQVEFYFDRPLASGDGFKIQWREDLSASFATTSLENTGIVDFATYGAIQDKRLTFTANVKQIQFRVLGTCTSSTLSPKLKYVRII